jgi:ethanolamine utilization protein EutN
MIICQVTGHVWATKKEASLAGLKLMVVQALDATGRQGESFVAADVTGAGIGERVLVASGSAACYAIGQEHCAADCAIVGIIDSLEVDRESMGGGEAQGLA